MGIRNQQCCDSKVYRLLWCDDGSTAGSAENSQTKSLLGPCFLSVADRHNVMHGELNRLDRHSRFLQLRKLVRVSIAESRNTILHLESPCRARFRILCSLLVFLLLPLLASQSLGLHL